MTFFDDLFGENADSAPDPGPESIVEAKSLEEGVKEFRELIEFALTEVASGVNSEVEAVAVIYLHKDGPDSSHPHAAALATSVEGLVTLGYMSGPVLMEYIAAALTGEGDDPTLDGQL